LPDVFLSAFTSTVNFKCYTQFQPDHCTYCKSESKLELFVLQKNMNLLRQWNCLQAPHIIYWRYIYQALMTMENQPWLWKWHWLNKQARFYCPDLNAISQQSQ